VGRTCRREKKNKKKKKKKEGPREGCGHEAGWAVALLGPGRGPVGLSFPFFVLSFILFSFLRSSITFA
jgi:hypothetical protein